MHAKSYQKIEALPEKYGSLFSTAAKESVFFSRPWYQNFINTVVNTEHSTYQITGLEDNDGSGPKAALLTRSQVNQRKLMRARELKSLTNYYSSLYGPVLDYDSPESKNVSKQLIKSLLDQNPDYDIVNLSPLHIEKGVFKSMCEAFQECGWMVQEYFCFGNWYLPTENLSFSDYFNSRPSQLKNTLKRKQKKFLKEPGARIEIITNRERLAEGLAAFQKVYEKSWKEPEPYEKFLPGLADTSAEYGWLRLGVAWIGNEPAAAQIWLVSNGTASIFKLAYDPQYNALSAGSLLTLALMEHVIEVDKVKIVDYLTGDDSYKKDWMSHRRERFGIIAFNKKTLRGLVNGVISIYGRSVKRAIVSLSSKLFSKSNSGE